MPSIPIKDFSSSEQRVYSIPHLYGRYPYGKIMIVSTPQRVKQETLILIFCKRQMLPCVTQIQR